MTALPIILAILLHFRLIPILIETWNILVVICFRGELQSFSIFDTEFVEDWENGARWSFCEFTQVFFQVGRWLWIFHEIVSIIILIEVLLLWDVLERMLEVEPRLWIIIAHIVPMLV